MQRDKLDLELINLLADQDYKEVTKIPNDDEQSLDLSHPLKKHKDHYRKLELRAAGSYLDMQSKFAKGLFILVCVWLSIVVLCVFFTGFKAWGFILSDTVLVAFITSTTATVLGLFVLVAKWLFQKNLKSK